MLILSSAATLFAAHNWSVLDISTHLKGLLDSYFSESLLLLFRNPILGVLCSIFDQFFGWALERGPYGIPAGYRRKRFTHAKVGQPFGRKNTFCRGLSLYYFVLLLLPLLDLKWLKWKTSFTLSLLFLCVFPSSHHHHRRQHMSMRRWENHSPQQQPPLGNAIKERPTLDQSKSVCEYTITWHTRVQTEEGSWALFPWSHGPSIPRRTHPEYYLCKLCHPIIQGRQDTQWEQGTAISYRNLFVRCLLADSAQHVSWGWQIRRTVMVGSLRITDSVIQGRSINKTVCLTFRLRKSKSSRDEWLNREYHVLGQL